MGVASLFLAVSVGSVCAFKGCRWERLPPRVARGVQVELREIVLYLPRRRLAVRQLLPSYKISQYLSATWRFQQFTDLQHSYCWCHLLRVVISSTQQQLPVRVMGCTGLVTGLQPHTVCSVLPEQRYCAVRPVLLLAQQQLVSEGAECSRSWSVQQPCRLLQYWLSSYRLGLLFPGQQ
jgi:hypothetical protein